MRPALAATGIAICVLIIGACEPVENLWILPAHAQSSSPVRTLADCDAVGAKAGARAVGTIAVSCASWAHVNANCRTITNPKGYPVTRVYCVWERPANAKESTK